MYDFKKLTFSFGTQFSPFDSSFGGNRWSKRPPVGWEWWLTPIIPALWEVGGSLEVSSSWQAWPTWWTLIFTKNTKISQAWGQTPVILSTWEAEAGESLEPRRWRLQWAETTPLHSSLSNKRETPTQKKEKKRKEKKRKPREYLSQHQSWQIIFY